MALKLIKKITHSFSGIQALVNKTIAFKDNEKKEIMKAIEIVAKIFLLVAR